MGFEDSILSRAEQEENSRLSLVSKKYIGTPPSEWPFSAPLWDLTLGSQRYVTSERTEKALLRDFPSGLLLATVNFAELDTKLVSAFRLSPEELWTACIKDKTARVVFLWSERTALTPPLLCPFNQFGQQEITITDGAHRLAVSRALNIEMLHILIEKDEYSKMKEMLPSLQLIPCS
ncbi:MAG: hypothetical protein WC787_01185 [Patescibacteria group bacterium]|jgi:hypothetical protein